MTANRVPFDDLARSDLVVDAIYEGGAEGHVGDDPISKVCQGVGNRGGFRYAGKGNDKKLVVLFSSGEDGDWPDDLDMQTGQFVYYGDNKRPGHQLHDTPRRGNEILNRAFELVHLGRADRARVPPFLVFLKRPTERSGWSVQFAGLAVPGHPGLSATQDLTAVWKSKGGQRFQNYRAVFTILDTPVIHRHWLGDVLAGNPHTENAPPAWMAWVDTGVPKPLMAESSLAIRSIDEQLPSDKLRKEILSTVWNYFSDHPILFESFAARLFRMTDSRVSIDLITRASMDGGRDAVGRYALGLKGDPVFAEFSLEAKCYRPGLDGASINTVGVKETSRLISRIRHREFGVLVTTSAIAKQAYTEVREDGHPIILIAGGDIADTLVESGFTDARAVGDWLEREFPRRIDSQ